MFDSKIEELAKCVRKSGGANALPVDLVALCKAEEIELVPLENHTHFNGKIEFLPDVSTFVIYYPDPSTYEYPRRARFSLAHELGHYHIEEHRQALIQGQTHNSTSGFKSRDPKEEQADQFAAALLIPSNLMEPTIEKRGFLTLKEVMDISARCEASLHATAIRYVRMASESCIAVVAYQGKVKWKFHSDEAHANYLGTVTCTDLPTASPAHRLCIETHHDTIVEKEHPAADWLRPRGEGIKIWEECVSLRQGYTLSLLSIKED
jgi:IrrE N-terminal-like domain